MPKAVFEQIVKIRSILWLNVVFDDGAVFPVEARVTLWNLRPDSNIRGEESEQTRVIKNIR